MFGDKKIAKNIKKQWKDVVEIVNGKDHKKVSGSGNYAVYGTGGRMFDSKEYMCDEGTIVMGRKGTIDKPYIVPEKCWIVDTAFGVYPKNDELETLYLYYYCKNIDYNKLNKACTLPSVTKSDLLELWIDIPPKEVQQDFSSFVNRLDKSKVVLKENIKRLILGENFMENDYMKKAEMVLYHTNEGDVSVNAIIRDETMWMTQKAMALLFGVEKAAISKHLSNIYEEKELDEDSTVSKMETVQNEGGRDVKRTQSFYNLDAIIAVGYRVNSKEATKFRIWATSVLKEYIKKGFVLDDERLKQCSNVFGEDYFKELLERVRSIRASERRIWQQITDIYAECSIDYDKDSETTRAFYATVQNKFHFAITGKTAAEIIADTADHTKEHMGLTTWKKSPEGRILKTDVSIAKNYLSLDDIRKLERLVTGYFDYIEDIIERQNTFTMKEFSDSVNEFINFRKYNILKDKGRVSHDDAVKKANFEYDIYNKTQKINSDFDKLIEETKKQNS